MISVVLDTNVLVSANINDEGLESFVVSLAFNKRLEFYVSPAILEEYDRVLRYPRLKFVSGEIDDFLALVRRVSIIVHPTRALIISRDEADNRFLECAEASQASFLVTGNAKHFPARHKNTNIVSPREFIGHIGSMLTERGQ